MKATSKRSISRKAGITQHKLKPNNYTTIQHGFFCRLTLTASITETAKSFKRQNQLEYLSLFVEDRRGFGVWAISGKS